MNSIENYISSYNQVKIKCPKLIKKSSKLILNKKLAYNDLYSKWIIYVYCYLNDKHSLIYVKKTLMSFFKKLYFVIKIWIILWTSVRDGIDNDSYHTPNTILNANILLIGII